MLKKTIKVYVLILITVLGWAEVAAQQKYWVLFKDKPTENYDYRQHLSPAAIEKRQRLGLPLHQYTDIPISQQYLQPLAKQEIQPIAHSKWLNAISAHLTSKQQQWIRQQPYVKEIIPLGNPLPAASVNAVKESTRQAFFLRGKSSNIEPALPSPSNLLSSHTPKWHGQPAPSLASWEAEKANTAMSWAVMQTQPATFLEQGISGKGVRVGVIDAGFFKASENPYLTHLFQDSLVKEVRDFLIPNRTDHFTTAITHSDWHGTKVLENIAGQSVKSAERKLYGLATGATFYLARTEQGNKEFRGEEDLWINALEWMDSLGVRLVNTSLGYGMGFDDPKENYLPEQMNGSTALITKAAQIAVEAKGIFIVASAGNEGLNSDWKVVSAPADAKGVLSVGATNKVGLKAGYSSLGPSFLPYLKPNVVCYSASGTSFSAPVIAGFVACLLEKYPAVSNKALLQAVEQSGSLYPYGNLALGYGVPQAKAALGILSKQPHRSQIDSIRAQHEEHVIVKKTIKRGVPWSTAVLLFHKIGENRVVTDKVLRVKKRKLKIKRPNSEINRTTVLFPNLTGLEIFWE